MWTSRVLFFAVIPAMPFMLVPFAALDFLFPFFKKKLKKYFLLRKIRRLVKFYKLSIWKS